MLRTGTINPSDKTILFQKLLGCCSYRFISCMQPVNMSSIVATLCSSGQSLNASVILACAVARKLLKCTVAPQVNGTIRCLGAIDVTLYSKAYSIYSCSTKPNCSVSSTFK